MLERLRSSPPSDDGIFRLLLPLSLQYLEEFVQSELLARKLSFFCARKLAQLCSGEGQGANNGGSSSGVGGGGGGGGVSPNSPAVHNTSNTNSSSNSQNVSSQQQNSMR